MAAELPVDFPDRIRRLRGRLGLTQTQFAARMGVSFASVNRWENGQSRPSTLAWRQIVRAEERGVDGLAPAASAASTEPAVSSLEVPSLDFAADAEVVRLVVEAERLGYGHLFNPAFATETAMIDPLPHQRMAVYGQLLEQPRLRFLLADDAGAGKTIMAGLYIREMLARKLIRRVLVVPPAGLVGNWEREMRTLFGLRFRIVSGADARTGNPFTGADSDLLIVSIDTVAGERMFGRLQEQTVQQYDLAIFDEAHKLAADRQPDHTIRRTDRYKVAEALGGAAVAVDRRWRLDWSCQHLLLLTATPHMGRDFPYFCLWRLLLPDVLPTIDAFNAFPADARRRHFLRRTKEEMVRFDGSRIYPTRVSDTLSYELTQGPVSEQQLYDETTDYIELYYNRARILNRSAARLAMSVFQRRLASSTYALMRSFARRLEKLDRLIDDIRAGRLSPDNLLALQRKLEGVKDVLSTMTGDEEEAEDGREENEVAEEQALGGVVAVSLAELEVEWGQVANLLELARRVHDRGEESKFEKLREVLRDERFRDEKILIFTEHRDTLEFLVRRLEGLGFTGQVAWIHGGMDYQEREAQVELFRKPAADGGATYLVATDAAGEGINLQFCWLMVNYDIPWNPARLEQRMGRIHRYKQAHDPVRIVNLVAGRTREGRVLQTLLTKLEAIRKELSSDKVFDVVGRFFEGVSLAEYLQSAVTEAGANQACVRLNGILTREQVEALEARERRLFGDGGDVKARLPVERERAAQDELRRLLPGYVRRFIEKAAPRLDLRVVGDIDGEFAIEATKPFALDPFAPALEAYPAVARRRLTVYRPAGDGAVFLRPGEALFDRLRAYVTARFWREALRGGVFVDPYASRPYLLHVAATSVERAADPARPALAEAQLLDSRLVVVRQEESGAFSECPVEHLLLLKAAPTLPASAANLAATVAAARELARQFAREEVAQVLAEHRRRALISTLAEREAFVARGFDYQDAELAALRAQFAEKARSGDARAQAELLRVKERQRTLWGRREEALATLRREPELIRPGEVTFLAHALVVPSADPEDRMRHDAEVEAMAVKVAVAFEQEAGARVIDVSTPAAALAAGLGDWPGFDLVSKRPSGEERAIEVKGRAGVGDVELKENEWAKACNLGDRYWLYVVFDCASPRPRLLRVRNPFTRLLSRPKGGVLVDEHAILRAAE